MPEERLKYWRFDGTNTSNIDTGVAQAISSSEGFVAGCLFRTFASYTGTTWAAIMGSNESGNVWPWELAVGNAGGGIGNDDGGFLFRRYGPGGGHSHWANAAANSIADGLWHSVIGGRTAAGKSYIVVDGVDAEGATTKTDASAITDSVFIGDRHNTTGQIGVTGDIVKAFHFRGPDLSVVQRETLSLALLMPNVGLMDVVQWASGIVGTHSGIWKVGRSPAEEILYGNYGILDTGIINILDSSFTEPIHRSVVKAPVAAGGNAMPMAMHHYRQRRAG